MNDAGFATTHANPAAAPRRDLLHWLGIAGSSVHSLSWRHAKNRTGVLDANLFRSIEGWTDSSCKKVRFDSKSHFATATYVNLNYGGGSLAV